MFDVGTYAKFDHDQMDTDSPEAERAYRLVRLYGERAKGRLYLRM